MCKKVPSFQEIIPITVWYKEIVTGCLMVIGQYNMLLYTGARYIGKGTSLSVVYLDNAKTIAYAVLKPKAFVENQIPQNTKKKTKSDLRCHYTKERDVALW